MTTLHYSNIYNFNSLIKITAFPFIFHFSVAAANNSTSIDSYWTIAISAQ